MGEEFGGSAPGGLVTIAALCVAVPGPCDPEDLIDGIIFAANYLGSTQLLSDKTPSKNVRMMQAQEAVSRIKVSGVGGGCGQPSTMVTPHPVYVVLGSTGVGWGGDDAACLCVPTNGSKQRKMSRSPCG